jgi:hypothetical protein
MIKEEGFDERGVSPDPEATIALEDDEMLELSIVNMPPFEDDAFNQNQAPEISVQAPTPEPNSTEQTLANMTEYNNKNDTLLRFVVIFLFLDIFFLNLLIRSEKRSSKITRKLLSLQSGDQRESLIKHQAALLDLLRKWIELLMPR